MIMTISLAKKFISMFVVTLGVAFVFDAPKASATHVAIPGSMPANIRADLSRDCAHRPYSPAFAQWVSPINAPTTTAVTVAYGQPSVGLQLNFVGVVCFTTSGVTEARLHTFSATANVPATITGIAGETIGLQWISPTDQHQVVGAFRSQRNTFTFAPVGGFRTEGTTMYNVTLDNRVINQFSNGTHGCVAGGPNPWPWRYEVCNRTPPSFNIIITVAAAPRVTCNSVTFNPAGNPEAGQPFTITGGLTVSGGAGGSTPIGLNVYIPSLGFSQPLYLGLVPRGSSLNRTTRSITAASGTHNGYFEVTSPDASPTVQRCNFTVRIVQKPYHRVYGGDVMAGAGFSNGTTCASEQDSSIVGWNRASNPYLGAGSQLAVGALGIVYDFASGTLRNRTVPKALTFANINPSYNSFGGSAFGGGLDASSGVASCAPNFFAERTAGASLSSSWNMPASADGVYTRSGDLSLTEAAGGLQPGARVKVYVSGDVTIRSNITYRDNINYADVASIPRFDLIVEGNIYVSSVVTRLDGVYIAQPRSGTNDTGRFYTCWPAHLPTAADLNGACRTNTLTVYGAIVAEIIKFTRSSGTLRQSTSTERYDSASAAAEVFVYTPEVWLTGGIGGDGGAVDSIVAQPPVL